MTPPGHDVRTMPNALPRWAAILALVAGTAGPAAADDIRVPSVAAGQVHFRSAATPPTPFQVRRARQRSEPLPQPKPGIELEARLSRPRGTGPFPAVVLLHGCGGLSPAQNDWAARLAGLGLVVLQVDSFAPRGIGETCTTHAAPNVGPQVFDAFGALAWLRGQAIVDRRRVAVMGWGHGGTAALDAVLATGAASMFDTGFAASVAFYPYCPGLIQRDYLAPVLVLSGGADDFMPAARCRRIAARPETGGDRITLVVYDGAYYGFDDPASGTPHPVPEVLNIERSPPKGATVGYDLAAHAGAISQVQAFLRRILP